MTFVHSLTYHQRCNARLNSSCIFYPRHHPCTTAPATNANTNTNRHTNTNTSLVKIMVFCPSDMLPTLPDSHIEQVCLSHLLGFVYSSDCQAKLPDCISQFSQQYFCPAAHKLVTLPSNHRGHIMHGTGVSTESNQTQNWFLCKLKHFLKCAAKLPKSKANHSVAIQCNASGNQAKPL